MMTKNYAKAVLMLSLLFLLESNVYANVYSLKSGDVRFTAIGKPGFLKINGESKGTAPQGSIEFKNQAASGEIKFDLKSLDTGISLRNEHMKDKYLEIEKYPEATLVLNPVPVSEKDLETSFEKDFSGTLTLHGVTKPVTGKFKFDGADKKVAAQFALSLADYGINVPKYLGITMSEKVEIAVATSVENAVAKK